MVFDQIAFRVPDPERAMRLLDSLKGLDTWIEDQVQTYGTVRGLPALNTARLFFNYQAFDRPAELELLRYDTGRHWHTKELQDGDGWEDDRAFCSHLGLHVEFTDVYLAWAEKQGLDVVQQVTTLRHTNSNVPSNRRYEYVIIETRHILGFDIKLIRRTTAEEIRNGSKMESWTKDRAHDLRAGR